MDRFLALPKEKQKTIIDAGLSAFGKMGYKKASVNDIATAAGISKAMIFHYFGSKKNMYLYLIDFAYTRFTEAFQTGMKMPADDFFQRILKGAEVKMTVLSKHPALLQFLASVYCETDPAVGAEIAEFLKKGDSFRGELVLTDIDRGKFKDTVKPELVLNIIVKCAEGYVGNAQILSGELDVDSMLEEFREIVSLMRDNFYKEDFL